MKAASWTYQVTSTQSISRTIDIQVKANVYEKFSYSGPKSSRLTWVPIFHSGLLPLSHALSLWFLEKLKDIIMGSKAQRTCQCTRTAYSKQVAFFSISKMAAWRRWLRYESVARASYPPVAIQMIRGRRPSSALEAAPRTSQQLFENSHTKTAFC